MQQTTTPRVLIVDDEEDLCQYLKLMISKKANYEVDIATDGAQAFEKIKGERFNLVISDINMPKMNGIDLLNNIKNFDPDIEVIMLTGKSSLETAVQALQCKAFDYIEKPVESRKLLVAMGNALGKQRLNLELKSVLDRVAKERKELKSKVEQQAAELSRKERLALTGAVAATLTGELMAPAESLVKKLDAIEGVKDNAAKVEELVREAKPQALRLLEVLKEVVAFSEQVRPNIQQVRVSDFLRKLIDYHQGLHKDVRFQLVGHSEGLEVPADSELLERAFGSIIENACDAMKETGQIDITVASLAQHIEISLVDTGPGVPADQAEKIFLPFFSTKGSQSSGLGLSIAKRILEDHRGDLKVDPAHAPGAKFVATLPFLIG
jgi:signal transduction histidine kinase